MKPQNDRSVPPIHVDELGAQAGVAWALVDEHVLSQELGAQSKALERALDQMKEFRDFIGSPENILGNPLTKHGEIAEHLTVRATNARSIVGGGESTSIIDGVDRTGPVDYLRDGIPIQSKYLAGLRNTLDAVREHALDNPDYAEGNLKYDIPKDQYETLKKILNGEPVEGFRLRSVEAIQRQLEKISEITGRDFDELIEPGIGTYRGVQQGQIHNTVAGEEQHLHDLNDERVGKIHDSHAFNAADLGKAAAWGAAAGAAIPLASRMYEKWKQGKNPFRGDYTPEDWKEIGLESSKGAAIGGVSAAGVYTLTKSLDLAAPVAGGVVVSLMGISKLLKAYKSGEIDKEEFVDQSLLVMADASLVCLGTMLGAQAGVAWALVIGQAVIPWPGVGGMLGAIGAKLLSKALRDTLGESELYQALEEEIAQFRVILNVNLKTLLDQIDARYDSLNALFAHAFDVGTNAALQLQYSAQAAAAVGVPEERIMRSVADVDSFMRE